MSDLSKRHRKVLASGSGISEAVMDARGYRTINDPKDLTLLGFTKKQALVPGLLIPMYGPDGLNGAYQFKPNTPRIIQGKPVKYETPKGSRVHLDCPPGLGDRLADPSVPLWITEGVKKADAAVTAGLVCVALQGVDCWRNSDGPLPEWGDIALGDRTVYVAFDSDVMLKDGGRTALDGLTRFLRRNGAQVLWAAIPSHVGLAGEEKQGLDDYLARGGDTTELTAAAVLPEVHDPHGQQAVERADARRSVCAGDHQRAPQVV